MTQKQIDARLEKEKNEIREKNYDWQNKAHIITCVAETKQRCNEIEKHIEISNNKEVKLPFLEAPIRTEKGGYDEINKEKSAREKSGR